MPVSLRNLTSLISRLRPGKGKRRSAAASTALAVDTIKVIYDLCQGDADRIQWKGDTSARTLLAEGYGFDWWPGDFKVRVRVNGPHPELDYPLYRLNIQTDFLRGVDLTVPSLARDISDLNRLVFPFAICAHPKSIVQTLEPQESLIELGLDLKSAPVWLGSTAYINEDTIGWLPRLFGGLAVLQPVEAQFRADLAARLLGGEADRSRPPGGASPTEVDDILGVDDVIAFHGQQPSKWIGTGEFEQIIARWGRRDSGYGDAGKDWLRMEMPFGDDTAVLKLATDKPHPRLGNGLRATLTLPFFDKRDSKVADLAIEMNFLEITHWLKVGAPLMGSWSAEDWGFAGSSQFAPAFSFFIPNLMYQPNLAETFVLYAMARAKWFRERFRPDAVDLPMHEILDKRLGLKKPQ
jgi:hypothetical protein